MRYEIINPSDKVFIYADKLVDAGIICNQLSSWYGLADDNGETVFPIMADEKWFIDRGITNMGQYIYDNRLELAKVAKSFGYAGERTSLNNIGKSLTSLSKALINLKPNWATEQK